MLDSLLTESGLRLLIPAVVIYNVTHARLDQGRSLKLIYPKKKS